MAKPNGRAPLKPVVVEGLGDIARRKLGEAKTLSTETVIANSDEKVTVPPTKVQVAEKSKKPSLRDLLKNTISNTNVQQVREEMDQAQGLDPEAILEYVRLRWELNQLPTVPNGFREWSWKDQHGVLAPLAKKSSGVRMMVETIEQIHENEFAQGTLNEVMNEFGLPLQGVKSLQGLAMFLEGAAQEGLATKTAESKSSEGITLLEDMGDATNHNTVTYIPAKGSKVARDSWRIVEHVFGEMQEASAEILALRKEATRNLTPFTISDKRDGKKGRDGQLFVMSPAGDWAILLNVESQAKPGLKLASISKAVGCDAIKGKIPWDNRGSCLANNDAERSDFLMEVNEILQDLNGRQHDRAIAEKEKSEMAFGSLKRAATLPSEPKDQGLHLILDGKEGIVAICQSRFWIQKPNGKVKSGHFGLTLRFSSQSGLTLHDVACSECFGFEQALIGMKLAFNFGEKNWVRPDIRSFCQENGLRGRLRPSYFASLYMICQVVKNRLNSEDRYAPDEDEDFDDEVLQLEDDLTPAELAQIGKEGAA